MKVAVSRLCVCAILLLGCGVFQNLAHAQGKPEVEAQKAGEQWLALVDAGKYGESWDAASPSFQAAMTRSDWVKKVTAARKPAGKLISRKLTKSHLVKDPPHSPPGQYVGIQYQSSFQNLNSTVETVVPMLDKDGKWRVTAYIVQKAGSR
jgi:hypothetical protein